MDMYLMDGVIYRELMVVISIAIVVYLCIRGVQWKNALVTIYDGSPGAAAAFVLYI